MDNLETIVLLSWRVVLLHLSGGALHGMPHRIPLSKILHFRVTPFYRVFDHLFTLVNHLHSAFTVVIFKKSGHNLYLGLSLPRILPAL